MVNWRIDRARVVVFDRGTDLALAVADSVCQRVAERAVEGCSVVLGLAAGATPRGAYRALALRRRTGRLDLRRAAAFGLDEYYPIDPRSGRSFSSQLNHVAEEIGLPAKRLNLLRGDTPRNFVSQHCVDYEIAIRRAGGIDFQLLGIGRNGHVAFNEPGTARTSRTRLVELSEQTRHDAAVGFGGLDRTPYKAITTGLGTIFEAREIALLAIGIHKAAIVKRVLEEDPSPQLPASLLRQHRCATYYLDSAAASLLKPGERADQLSAQDETRREIWH